ncbi:MAG TPA: hypothetical protein VNC50_04550 [Planctomycetia bacterium]|nr:hypothetical protein [Planctomycetia bacterium]
MTKYDPKLRNPTGAYTRNEWTSFSDVGRSFDGAELTSGEYRRIEDAYVAAAVAFLREAGVPSLTVRTLENARGRPVPFGEGEVLSVELIPDMLRGVLREEFWCRLEAVDAFVHVGWDYYMYVGVPRPCPFARLRAGILGLYVEQFASPYREDSSDT